jgi:ABC-type multidrug transport system ATPase subunit
VQTVLVWQHLTVSVAMRGSTEKKLLLDNVSGSMNGGNNTGDKQTERCAEEEIIRSYEGEPHASAYDHTSYSYVHPRMLLARRRHVGDHGTIGMRSVIRAAQRVMGTPIEEPRRHARRTRARDQKLNVTLLVHAPAPCESSVFVCMYVSLLSRRAGKSTLLNALAFRLDTSTCEMSGDLRMNGRAYENSELKRMSGYVMQDDLLNPYLTVRETLYYTGELRLPATFTPAQRSARVGEVIAEMGLTHCENVIVGDPSKKGISGGERRRVCIGMELLTRPTLLFLDEPTSGLDSVTALSLVRLLQKLTRSGKCSMLISIHQPQAKLFALFDRLLLLKSGSILFQGSIPDALKLFEDCGFPVPHYSNPADHLLDVITPPMDITIFEEVQQEAAMDAFSKRRQGSRGNTAFDLEVATSVRDETPRHKSSTHELLGNDTPLGKALLQRRTSMDELRDVNIVITEFPLTADMDIAVVGDSNEVELRRDQKNEALLLSHFRQPHIDLGFGSSKPFIMQRHSISWLRQTSVLMQRNLKESIRKKWTLYTSIAQTIIMAILISTVFLQIGTSQSSIVRRQPVLFFVCINQGMFGALGVINSFPAERALMLRERASGTYYASAYFAAKTTVDTLLSLPIPILFSTIVYWLTGFQPTGAKFIIFTIFMILCSLSATSLALMISALCKTTDLSVTILPMVLECARLFGGFFLSPTNLPGGFKWLNALSYVQYAYVGVSLNELSGLELHCDAGQLVNGVCPFTSGEQFIHTLGLDYISMNGCIGVLFGYIFATRIVAYLAIRFMKTP